MNVVHIKKEDWNILCLKSSSYRYDSYTILKSIGLILYEMWNPSSKDNHIKDSWIKTCESVENESKNIDVIKKEGFTFKMEKNEEGIDLIIETNSSLLNKYNGISESAKQIVEFLVKNEWDEAISNFIPSNQLEKRAKINNTYKNITCKCLHEEIFENALKYSNDIALIYYEDGIKNYMTYNELKEESLKIAKMLSYNGVKENDLVGLVLPKGIDQIIGILGILAVGGVYVPIGIKQPLNRKKNIIDKGQIKYILTNNHCTEDFLNFNDIKVMSIEKRNEYKILDKYLNSSIDSPAYIIFTSGSSGEPKGVIISHKSAYNTIADVNEKFNVTKDDCAIGISELDFDLSVYDIFGLLSVGGKLLIVDENNKKEASIWNRYIIENNVTLWNSVPALYNMLLVANEVTKNILTLKKVFLSGDWIQMDLFDRTKDVTTDCRFISMGGATEASIWSNYYEVNKIEEYWQSIPYGQPLSNQKMRIVNNYEYDCPNYVEGELWLGGEGVANGYLNQQELTNEKFVVIDGIRWYKTGDMARYDEDGIVEFLGRIDNQVKLNGFRIELGEIENTIKKYKGINEVVAQVVQNESSKHLVASIVPTKNNDQEKVIQKSRFNSKNITDRLAENEIFMEKFLLKLCYLDNLVSKDYKNCYCSKNSDLFKNWCIWLQNRQVIDIQEENIIQGKRYNEVLHNMDDRKNEIKDSLYKNIDLLRKVLKGEEEESVLLDCNSLSPEYLSLQGEGTIHCFKQIIERIQEKSSTQRIAILGARSGLVAEKIIEEVRNVEVTLFDNSLGMLEEAKERLSKYSMKFEYKQLIGGYINKDDLYKYDFVIALNTLHQYINPYQGVNIGSMLIKDEGNLLAVEYANLDPLGMIISGLLENGFNDFNAVRSRKNNPLLTLEEWCELFTNTNFSYVNIKEIDDSSAMLIDATIKQYKNEFNAEALLEYLKDQLPSYMIPEKIELFLWFPLNKNGKVDRKKIEQIINKNNYVANKVDDYIGIESEIAIIWSELLQCTSIARENSFFEIGGDSLLATKFLAIIKNKYNIDVSLREMFDRPKLFQVSETIDNATSEIGAMVEGEI
jgi:amino acid adenylation domain-containing protein